jgi:hypothetical protein
MYVIQTEKVQLVLKQVHFDSHQEMWTAKGEPQQHSTQQWQHVFISFSECRMLNEISRKKTETATRHQDTEWEIIKVKKNWEYQK